MAAGGIVGRKRSSLSREACPEDDSSSRPAKKAKKKGSETKSETNTEWSNEELSILILNIKKTIPKDDYFRFNTMAGKLDWKKVQFGKRSEKRCREKWLEITRKLRRYRTMSELVVDAEEWLKHPWAVHSKSRKPKQHPDMPKRPLTPYFRYFLEKREKYQKAYPSASMTDLAKKLALKFKTISERRKAKYQAAYERENVVYLKKLEEFKLLHPDININSGKQKKSAKESIKRPQTPFQLFRDEKIAKICSATSDASLKAAGLEQIKKHWSILSEPKRVKWIRKAFIDDARYAAALEEYCINHTDYKTPVYKPSLTKQERELKDKYDGKPDRPPNSGYSLYSRVMMKELNNMPSKEKMREISKRWRQLSEVERISYNKQAAELLITYKEQFGHYLSNLSPEERERALAKPLPKKKKAKSPDTAEVIIDSEENKHLSAIAQLQLFQKNKTLMDQDKHPSMSKEELMKLVEAELGGSPEEKNKKMTKKDTESNSSTLKKIKGYQYLKNEPKKPPSSAYSLYSTEMLRSMTDIEPKKRMGEIARRWKEFPPEQREEYKTRLVEMAKKYNKEYTKFINSLSPSELEIVEKLKNKNKTKNVETVNSNDVIKKENVGTISSTKNSSSEGSDSSSSDDSSDDDDKDSSSAGGSSSDDSDSENSASSSCDDDNDSDMDETSSDDDEGDRNVSPSN